MTQKEKDLDDLSNAMDVLIAMADKNLCEGAYFTYKSVSNTIAEVQILHRRLVDGSYDSLYKGDVDDADHGKFGDGKHSPQAEQARDSEAATGCKDS